MSETLLVNFAIDFPVLHQANWTIALYVGKNMIGWLKEAKLWPNG